MQGTACGSEPPPYTGGQVCEADWGVGRPRSPETLPHTPNPAIMRP